MQLIFHRDADQIVKHLMTDPTRADLLRRIIQTINTIRNNPETAEARRQSWQTEDWGQVWAVPVRAHDDDWIVIWAPYEPDAVLILYVGEAP